MAGGEYTGTQGCAVGLNRTPQAMSTTSGRIQRVRVFVFEKRESIRSGDEKLAAPPVCWILGEGEKLPITGLLMPQFVNIQLFCQ